MDYRVRENAFSYKELYGFSPNLKKSSIGFFIFFLFLYLATSKLAISAILLKLGLDGSQLPVYYVSKAMLLVE